MTTKTLALALALVCTAASACDDDGTPMKPDAGRGGSTPATGGRVGTGGTTATGGTKIDAGSETGGVLDTGTEVGDDGGVDATDDAAVEAGSDTPIDPDASGDTGVDAVTGDSAPQLDGGVVVVTPTTQLPCLLFNIAKDCKGRDTSMTTCKQSSVAGNNMTTYNFCHENGVKKLSVHNGATGINTMKVKKPDGSDCYTLEMQAAGTKENWTYRSNSGQVLGSAVVDLTAGNITITCEGASYFVSYDTSGDVPGTDGEPGLDDCPVGTCTVPN